MKRLKSKMIKDTDAFQIKAKSVKEITDENGAVSIEVEGYASTRNKDRGNDIVEPEAFKSAMDTYMSNPIVLLQHDMDKPIGVVTQATIDEKGLFIKAKISEDEDGVFSKLKNGVLRCFSIGYKIKDFEDRDVYNAEGEYVGGECVIKDLELYEISIVSVPMNPYAMVKSMSNCFEQEEVDEGDETEGTYGEYTGDTNENAEEQKVDENVEEKTEETETPVIENEQETVEETVEENNVENDAEETKEVETEETPETVDEGENTEECTTTVEQMDEMIDENKEEKNEEVNENEDVTDTDDDTTNNDKTQADENSEIVEQDTNEKDDSSENVVETTTDENVEKNVNLKEMSRKSIAQFIESETKSNNEKIMENVKSFLDKKDEEIATLKSELKATQDALLKCAEYISEIDTVLTNTVTRKGMAFFKAEKKNETAYSNVVKLVKGF